MPQHLVNEKALRYMEYLNRETDNRHHTLNEDEYQYALVRATPAPAYHRTAAGGGWKAGVKLDLGE